MGIGDEEFVKQAVEILKKRLPPDAKVLVDPPLLETGMWHIDVTLGRHSAVLVWQPKKGFGVCKDLDPGFGEGPDEVYQEMGKAVDRIVHLLVEG